MMAERKQRRAKSDALRARRGEAGITLLLVLFIAAVMIIAASVAVPNLILQERRQQEKLMIWRGRQYSRAIGLYYRKTGHFPHNLKELAKGVNGVHFLRKAYKDPMSPDGSWRLIYLGAGGQLIGSLCWRTLAEYQAAEMGVPIINAATTTGTAASQASPFDMADTATGKSKEPTVPTCQMIGQNTSSSLSVQTIMEGDMVGGNLIGVGGTANAPSVKHYLGADNYKYWEFIWSPQKNQRKLLPGASPATGNGKPGPPKKPTKPGSSPTTTPAPPQSPNNQSSNNPSSSF